MKKYEFTGKIKSYRGRELKQIKRLSDGIIGGWIEKEENLSHEGSAWVYEDAIVYGNARVYDDAIIYGNAVIYGNARVYGNTIIYGNAVIYGNTIIYGNARVYDDAIIYGNAVIYGNARVYGNTIIYGNARVYDDAIVSGNARVYGNTIVYGNAVVHTGEIIGKVQIPFKKIEFYKDGNTRMITAIKTLEDEWLFNIGCQELITKQKFIYRIHNEGGGLTENPHREFYIKILQMF